MSGPHGADFSPEEIGILRTLFDEFDVEREGMLHMSQLPLYLDKLGKSTDETIKVLEHASRQADENGGRIFFDELLAILRMVEKQTQEAGQFDGTDPKVLQFLAILEEHRIQCEDTGNYLEASRAHKQLSILRQQEERRQQKVIQARQLSERQDVQLAHNLQYQEFVKAWDQYLEEYDQMAQMYIQQMTERHALVLLEFQKRLREELASKPPKWSRALMDQRRKQHINARNKNYAMAQKLKKMSDIHEQQEREEMEQAQAIAFARREAKFRQQQQTELQALLKRIEGRRKEHIAQRELDTKRLLQRNRNVQAVLESKHNAEAQKAFAEIKKNLYSNSILYAASGGTATRKSTTRTSMDTMRSTGGRRKSPGYLRTSGRSNTGGNNNAYNSSESESNFQLPSLTHDHEMMSAVEGPSAEIGDGELSAAMAAVSMTDEERGQQLKRPLSSGPGGNNSRPPPAADFTSLVYRTDLEEDSLV